MRVKKSFSLRFRYRGGNSDPGGERGCTDRNDQVLLFRPASDRYRRRLISFVAVSFLGMCLAFLSLFLAEPLDKWVGFPGMGCVFIGLLLYFTAPALACPACGKATDSGFGQFCPACGHTPIRISRLLGTRCDGCGRTMGSYKYRNYPIRFCTHCGALVHRQGV
jgi:hypothetical protein